MRGYLIDIEFMWGFQARIAGMSKTSSSFPYPPPSTILGAITEAYSIRKMRGEGDFLKTLNEISTHLIALSYRSLNAIPMTYQDINRVLAVGQRGGVNYPSVKDPYGSFDAPARGKTVLVSVDDSPPTLRVALIVDDLIELKPEDLWKIKRIGSKESLVSVVDVVEITPQKVGKPSANDGLTISGVNHSIPLLRGTEIQRIEGMYITEYFVNIYRKPLTEPPAKLYITSTVEPESEDIVKYIIGLPLGGEEFKAVVKLSNGLAGYKMRDEVVIGLEPSIRK
ncbi:MAG: type I-A CRISPR-associated protein Cas5 [Zestosphaera tikiterensis]|uniref:Type I-A CRISPR-associated protein Cas5 n=1 Tax=Zestosphaera tikiterensis TaxID=1973259 RepID=A0A2R7Y0W6_9CREN|nr:MAG: type I-A CRISPR-associated protein Cas5 [Zestosphaera tikiterensis]